MKKNENIKALVKEMTLEKKISVLTGKDGMSTVSIDEYSIRSKQLADGPHGIRADRSANCTQFPCLCNLAASWDIHTAEKMGEALGNECINHKIDMLLAPGINIKRTPFCGRNFEYISEDPVLAGEMGAAYINGVQKKGVATSLKHYAANNQEKDREAISVEIDERTLRELYLKAFEIVLKKAKPESIMCAYNKINAIWCSENPFILNEVLRGEWGYDGIVVSDWDAVHNEARAINAGLDLHMPPKKDFVNIVKTAVKNGELSEDTIDSAVERILKFLLKENNNQAVYNRDAQHTAAKEIAASGIVLLKNENEALPLSYEKYKRIAVIGEFADKPLTGGQGSAEVLCSPEYIESPLENLRKLLPNTEIEYREVFKKKDYSENMLWPIIWSADYEDFIGRAGLVIVFAGSMVSEDTENFDRRSIQLNPNYEMFIEKLIEKGKKTVVVLQTGSAVLLGSWKNNVSAIVETYLGGESVGAAIAEVLCGVVNPSGKLPETFPNRIRTDLDYPGDGTKVVYNERLDVGYRYYDKHPEEICYPFGHGLSYTEFLYSDIRLEKEDGDYKAYVKIKNIGKCAGAEVVQLYIADMTSTVTKPIKELKRFKKVQLNSGEETTVAFCLNKDDFSYYNVMLHDWVVENGKYEILVGASSRDIRLKTSLVYNEKMPYTMNKAGSSVMG